MQDIPYDVSHVPIDYDDHANVDEVSTKISRQEERRERRDDRAALERDVSQLQKRLIVEINMRNALNRGLSRPLGSLPRIYASLPAETRELLLEVAVLEEEIASLEKQVVHLGRAIDIEGMPTPDKEPVWQNSNLDTSPEELDSPSISPTNSARITSKPSLSPRKALDQKSRLSKPSSLVGKSTENKSSSLKTVSNLSRNAASSMKSSRSVKDAPEARISSTLVPHQKCQLQKSSSLPKVSLTNTKDVRSRRLPQAKTEPRESSTRATPFVLTKISTPKEPEETTGSPLSPAPSRPSDLGSTRVQTENGRPSVTRNARLGRKDLPSNKAAPTARSFKAQDTPRPPGQDKGPQRTSGVTNSTRRTLKSSTASLEQRRTSLAPDPNITSNSDSNLQVPVDAEAGREDTDNEEIPAMDELDGDHKATQLSPDMTKINQPDCSPELHSKLGTEKEADSVVLSEEVVKFLKTIYGNMQARQTPLASELDSSSQASVSPSHSSASLDDYEMRAGANVHSRLSDCYTGSFISKRSVNLNYLQDCGEAVDTYTYLNKGSLSNQADFHQRLMS